MSCLRSLAFRFAGLVAQQWRRNSLRDVLDRFLVCRFSVSALHHSDLYLRDSVYLSSGVHAALEARMANPIPGDAIWCRAFGNWLQLARFAAVFHRRGDWLWNSLARCTVASSARRTSQGMRHRGHDRRARRRSPNLADGRASAGSETCAHREPYRRAVSGPVSVHDGSPSTGNPAPTMSMWMARARWGVPT